MERGDLSGQPELETSTSNHIPTTGRRLPEMQETSDSKDTGNTNRKKHKERQKTSAVKEDGFFGNDSDDDEAD